MKTATITWIILGLGAAALASSARAGEVVTEKPRAADPDPQRTDTVPVADAYTPAEMARLDITKRGAAQRRTDATLTGSGIGTAISYRPPPDETAGGIGTAVSYFPAGPEVQRLKLPSRPSSRRQTAPFLTSSGIGTAISYRPPAVDPPVVDDLNQAIEWLWTEWGMTPAQLWNRWVLMPMADAVRLFDRIHAQFILTFQEATWEKLLTAAQVDYADQFEPYEPR
jgi:hypothetical protein